MTSRFCAMLAAGLLPLLVAASSPPLLSQISPGLWEVTGKDGAQEAQICVSNPAALAQIEHRGARCDRTLVRNDPGLAVIEYACPGSDFGHSEIQVLTPRSVRIETQGIAGNAPFAYVVQARRRSAC